MAARKKAVKKKSRVDDELVSQAKSLKPSRWGHNWFWKLSDSERKKLLRLREAHLSGEIPPHITVTQMHRDLIKGRFHVCRNSFITFMKEGPPQH